MHEGPAHQTIMRNPGVPDWQACHWSGAGLQRAAMLCVTTLTGVPVTNAGSPETSRLQRAAMSPHSQISVSVTHAVSPGTS